MTTLVLGASGLLGREIYKQLEGPKVGWSSSCQDLTQKFSFNEDYVLDAIYMCAGRVGGIKDNMNHQWEFLYQNALMALNTINAALEANVENFYYISSSCVYPPSDNPLREEDLMNGRFEPTNEGYALAKLVGMNACKLINNKTFANFRSFTPCNLYGPGAKSDSNAHVIGSLINKFMIAKRYGQDNVQVWGDGTPRREFMHAKDAASAILHMINQQDLGSHLEHNINIGTGTDISIKELAELIADRVSYSGKISFQDSTWVNGAQRKLLDISILNSIGFKPVYRLDQGIDEIIYEYGKSIL